MAPPQPRLDQQLLPGLRLRELLLALLATPVQVGRQASKHRRRDRGLTRAAGGGGGSSGPAWCSTKRPSRGSGGWVEVVGGRASQGGRAVVAVVVMWSCVVCQGRHVRHGAAGGHGHHGLLRVRRLLTGQVLTDSHTTTDHPPPTDRPTTGRACLPAWCVCRCMLSGGVLAPQPDFFMTSAMLLSFILLVSQPALFWPLAGRPGCCCCC